MGGALVEGLLKCDSLTAGDISVSDPNQVVLEKLAQEGVSITTDNQLAVEGADVVAVVVKPWLVEQVLSEIKGALDYQRQLLIVIAAGVPSDSIEKWLTKADEKTLPFFLVIPNIAIAQRQSMTFIVPIGASSADTQRVTTLFEELGRQMVIPEKLLPAATTLASCGIAYALRYVRAASEGGVELGFKAHEAQEIVMQTVKGAVGLLEENDSHPEAEIDKVTTPGGVTIRGLNEMEHAGFTSSVIRGLKAGM